MNGNDITAFIVQCVGYIIIFRTIDMGRVESEKYSTFSKMGILQMLLVILATTLIEAGDILYGK
jgi:hypothetical protein